MNIGLPSNVAMPSPSPPSESMLSRVVLGNDVGVDNMLNLADLVAQVEPHFAFELAGEFIEAAGIDLLVKLLMLGAQGFELLQQ